LIREWQIETGLGLLFLIFSIFARKQEGVAIKIDQVNADALQDGPDVGIPTWEDVIAVFHIQFLIHMNIVFSIAF